MATKEGGDTARGGGACGASLALGDSGAACRGEPGEGTSKGDKGREGGVPCDGGGAEARRGIGACRGGKAKGGGACGWGVAAKQVGDTARARGDCGGVLGESGACSGGKAKGGGVCGGSGLRREEGDGRGGEPRRERGCARRGDREGDTGGACVEGGRTKGDGGSRGRGETGRETDTCRGGRPCGVEGAGGDGEGGGEGGACSGGKSRGGGAWCEGVV